RRRLADLPLGGWGRHHHRGHRLRQREHDQAQLREPPMPEHREKNAIERRIDRLRAQWEAFAALPDARLLLWLAGDGEERMIEAFVEVESDDRAGELPHLFLRLDVPFADPGAFGFALRDTIVAQYEQSLAGLREA